MSQQIRGRIGKRPTSRQRHPEELDLRTPAGRVLPY